MNLIENHSSRKAETEPSQPPPDFILKLRLDWYQLASRVFTTLENHPAPANARHFLKELDLLTSAFDPLKVRLRRQLMTVISKEEVA